MGAVVGVAFLAARAQTATPDAARVEAPAVARAADVEAAETADNPNAQSNEKGW